MKFENTSVHNFKGSIMGMRNPLQSWAKSDSMFGLKRWNEYLLMPETTIALDKIEGVCADVVYLGEKDLDLAQRLIKGGPEHRKFLRQIQVCVDITAPIYIWKELDTYKIGTVANSTSTMHKLASTPITFDCFELDGHDGFDAVVINGLEDLRQQYLRKKDKAIWRHLVQLLPESWLQTRTITFNYEILRNICSQREGHKLSEWNDFISWAKTLPYADELIFY